jgi:transposase
MIYLAADVAKAEFVTFDGKQQLTVPNQKTAIGKCLKELPPQSVVALEATATYGDLLARMAYDAGHTVYLIQPAWIKAHRRANRIRAKNDKIDARQIYEYCVEKHSALHPWRPFTPLLHELRSLVRQRQRLADDIARTRQRYKALQMDSELIVGMLQGMLSTKAELDKEIKQRLAKIPSAKKIMSIPGIGVQIAAAVVVVLEHFAFKSSDAFIGFVGLDPVPNESGNSKKPRRISKKGDVFLRRAFFIAAMTGCVREPWKERYQKLLGKGLKPKQALTALAKKIATVAFHLHRLQVDFDPEKVNLIEA